MKSPGCLATPVQQRCEQNGEPFRLPSTNASSSAQALRYVGPAHRNHFCRTLLRLVHSGRDVTVPPPWWHRRSPPLRICFLAAEGYAAPSLASVVIAQWCGLGCSSPPPPPVRFARSGRPVPKSQSTAERYTVAHTCRDYIHYLLHQGIAHNIRAYLGLTDIAWCFLKLYILSPGDRIPCGFIAVHRSCQLS